MARRSLIVFAVLAVAVSSSSIFLAAGVAAAEPGEVVAAAEPKIEVESKKADASSSPLPASPAPAPAAPAPAPASKTERDLAKVDAGITKAYDKTKEAYDKTKESVEDAYKKTKAGFNRAIDWIKDDKEIAETKLMAARPPPAVLKRLAPSKEAADVAVKQAAGTSVAVPGGATVQHPKEKGAKGGSENTAAKELAVATSVDVTSGAELAAALSAGEVQAVADALIAVVAEQAPPSAPKGSPGGAKSNATISLVNEAVADAVTELILTTREAAAAPAADGEREKAPPLSRLEALGVAFGAAMREAALGADVTPKQHAPGAKPLTASPLAIADSLVAGIQGAAVPCAADVGGPGAAKNTTAWYGAAAKTCCGPVAAATMRAAQAAVNDGPDAARTALYSALSRSVDLGGPGSFALARCSPPNAKE